jgi:hypothetical protein
LEKNTKFYLLLPHNRPPQSCRERSETWGICEKDGEAGAEVLLHVMASSPFREFTRKEFEEQLNDDDDDDDEEREIMTMKVK